MSLDPVFDGGRLLAAGGAVEGFDRLVGLRIDHHVGAFWLRTTLLFRLLRVRIAKQSIIKKKKCQNKSGQSHNYKICKM